MAMFAGQTIFDSGPHRVSRDVEGTLDVAELALGNESASTRLLGPRETRLEVRGRLVGLDDQEILDALAGVRALVTDPPTEGLFVDQLGNEYEKMLFIGFETHGPLQRGRARSIGYTARFLQSA